jgi:hypothetical protein
VAGSTLAEVNPGLIDVKSLEQRQYSAEFFLDQIRRRIGATKGPGPRISQVVIVLSSAVRFEAGQEIHPIALDGPTGAKLFYIRYQPPPQLVMGPPGAGRRGRMPNTGFPARSGYAGIDQLEPLLKPLDPRLFEVGTPEQFRKAIASILAEIAKL